MSKKNIQNGSGSTIVGKSEVSPKASRLAPVQMMCMQVSHAPNFLVERGVSFKGATIVLCIIVAVFAFFAYRFNPSPDMDLARYYAQIEYGRIDSYGADVYGDIQTPDVAITFVMRNLVKHGFPSHVLGGIAAVVYFGLIAKISLLWSSFRAPWVSPVGLFLIFIFSGYFLAFTGIRYVNACLIFILSLVYFELGKKKLALALSFLSLCVHFSLLPIFALFWGSVLLPKKVIWGCAGVMVCLTPWMIPVMQKVQGVFYSFGSVFVPIANRMDSYIFDSYGVLPLVINLLITGQTNVDIRAFWAGSRWWVGLELISCAMFGLLFVALKKEQRVIFRNLPIEKFYPIFLAYMIFTVEAPSIPMRSMMIVRFLVILTLLPMLYFSRSILPKLYFFAIALLAILATASGLEIVGFFLGGY